MFNLVKPILRVIFCATLASAGGCQGLAAILDKTGDPIEPAKYTPTHDSMLVLVESYQNPALVEMTAEHMNRLVGEELIAHKVAPIINPNRLTSFRAAHWSDYRKMKVEAIGTELKAWQILYVDVTEFTVESVPGAELRKGHAEATVKVIDARTGEKRWPDDAGYQVTVEIPFADDEHNVTEKDVRRALTRELSSRIAKLFYGATTKEQEPVPNYPESDLLQ